MKDLSHLFIQQTCLICDVVEKNQVVNLNRMVESDRIVKIWQALQVVGSHSLTQIREYLGSDYTYDEIRLVRGRWRHEKQE